MSTAALTFGAKTTAAEVVNGIDLTGKTAVVTGGASGIGIETARALASAGATVTLAVRDADAGKRAAADISQSTGNAAVTVSLLDLADTRSVTDFTDRWSGPLSILVNNAGVMMTPEQRTADGWELQFATNHLGHFALTVGLHYALAAADGARVVSVASSGHGASPVVFDDIHFERRAYDPMSAYGQSKTAQILFAVEASRRWAEDGITANALMPGGIWTNLQRHWDQDELTRMKSMMSTMDDSPMKTPEQGAATSVLLAAHPSVAGVAGRYFEDCHEADVVPSIVNGLHGVRDYALDPDAARQLWDASTDMWNAALS